MKKWSRLLFILPIGVLLWLSVSFAKEYSWEIVEEMISQRYPNTPTMDIYEFTQRRLREDIIVVDVRPETEFRVGHLYHARNLDTPEKLVLLSKNDTIVLYCSVGYRSAKMVHHLQEQGYEHVFNLKGSIFAWANAGFSVFRGEKQVETVHPFNEMWGQLLEKKYHAYQ